jgi:hypothetical protein
MKGGDQLQNVQDGLQDGLALLPSGLNTCFEIRVVPNLNLGLETEYPNRIYEVLLSSSRRMLG